MQGIIMRTCTPHAHTLLGTLLCMNGRLSMHVCLSIFSRHRIIIFQSMTQRGCRPPDDEEGWQKTQRTSDTTAYRNVYVEREYLWLPHLAPARAVRPKGWTRRSELGRFCKQL